MIPKEDCVDIEMCPDTFEKECKTVPESKCIQVPMKVCETVTKTIPVIIIVELEVQSRGPYQVPSQIGQKTFLPLGEMDLEQTLKLVIKLN